MIFGSLLSLRKAGESEKKSIELEGVASRRSSWVCGACFNSLRNAKFCNFLIKSLQHFFKRRSIHQRLAKMLQLILSIPSSNCRHQQEMHASCLEIKDYSTIFSSRDVRRQVYVAFFVSPLGGVFWMIWFCCCVLCSFSWINSAGWVSAGCVSAWCRSCSWYFLKFSSTSKCVKRFDMLESPEWSVLDIPAHPSFFSKSVNCFSSFRSQGRWSSCTWYGVTWTCTEMPSRQSVSRRLRAVIQVFLPPPCPPSSQYMCFILDTSFIIELSSGVNVFM